MIHCDCPDTILCCLVLAACVACCDNNWMHELPSDNEIYCLFTQLLNAAAQFSSSSSTSATPLCAPFSSFSLSLTLWLFMLSASWANVGQFTYQLWRGMCYIRTTTAESHAYSRQSDLLACSRSFSIYESDNSQVGAKIASEYHAYAALPRCWRAKVNVATSVRDNLLVFE